MKIRTSDIQNGQKVEIPLCPASFFNDDTLNLTVDWGDGSDSETITSFPSSSQITNNNGDVICNLLSHTYNNGAGKKTITITGGFDNKIAFMKTTKQGNDGKVRLTTSSGTRWRFIKIYECNVGTQFYIHGQGDFRGFGRLKELGANIASLTSTNPASEIALDTSNSSTMLMDKTFWNCGQLRYFGGFRPVNMTSMQFTFGKCTNLDKATGLNNWNCTKVTTARGCMKESDVSVDLWKWFKEDELTEYQITDTSSMFEGSTFNKKINTWDLSTVEDASSMFKESHYNQPAWAWFKTEPAVTNVSSMFEGSNFNQGINAWDVTGIENASGMFKGSKFDKPLWSWFTGFSGEYSIGNLDSMFEDSEFSHSLENWSGLPTGLSMTKFLYNSSGVINTKIPPILDNTIPNSTIINSNFSGYVGQRSYDDNYFYVATEENSWQRTAMVSTTRSSGIAGTEEYNNNYYYINVGQDSWGQMALANTDYSAVGSAGDTGVEVNYYYLNTNDTGEWRQIGIADW